MTWPACLSERFISPSLRTAFGSLPRRADIDTVVVFLADQFVGDFDGMGAEFQRLATRSESEDPNESPVTPGDVDTPFRLRVLYLLYYANPSSEHIQTPEREDMTDADCSGSDSDIPPPPKAVKRQSLPLEFKKPRRKDGGMLLVNIDNSLLALLGRPLQPNLPRGKPRKEVATPKSKRVKMEEGSEQTRPFIVDTRGGIRSSTFAAVMRLVAGLEPARSPRPTVKLPAPARAPPVWAQSRQELCEALPYYRAFQSGMYMCKRVPFGYLLDGFPSPGGQAVRVTDATGKVSVSLAADHTRDDARIDTLVLAAQRQSPIILLAGEGYALLPWKLGCAYAVLGWYWVSCTWYEAEPCAHGVEPRDDRQWFRRLKVRFDWIDTQGTPWWLTKGEPWVAPDDVVVAIEDGRLPPTPVSQYKELGQPTQIAAIKVPVSQLVNPPTPPQDPPPRVARESSGDHMIGDTHDVWARPPASEISTSPFGDLYFSPLAKSRGGRLPGDHLLANYHDDPSPSSPWRVSAESCPTCSNDSPRLYVEGWTCLVPECTQFWMLMTAVGIVPIAPCMRLSYDESFLRVIPTPFDASSLPYSIVPPLPSSAPGVEVLEEAGSRSLWRGFVCICGRSNCRYRWECLSCRACGRQVAAQTDSDVVPAWRIKHGRADPLGEADEGSPDLPMSVSRMSGPSATVVAYELPQAGTLYHVMFDTTGRADAIWEAYQRAAIQTLSPLFQRRALKTKAVKGQLLSQQFAINSGASYKYIVETLSYPFSDSPDCVMEALDVIRECVASVLDEAVDFNEVLSVMYREGQKMSWHDDGEHGLGPVVAALSLGSPATMSFRPKLGYKAAPKSPSVLNLTLMHGDVVIMAGRAIQYRYDHRVIPEGLRVAATARVIRGASSQ
ncbi:uncharacterized protein CcaverHIS019_0306530 [Cutaneotrichosporon cavernicola]|uniref:Fe2OG dioxygenase domain-containing protein n=1 Tax=Cutaneotrichosporon cavernicola TaxID=279322 RepID=A0AA48IGX9_9TREE|nr:uncharacterized protein CcaverHIS019_0306530 [Cutaneotrichosporon cavernicola]BEI90583.1 hypothetical protein CcaverHIS019_0306530 [Cutaneotrichosporon cavernicola]